MNILFIQLSDIHFTKDDNSLLEKEQQLVSALSNNCKDSQLVFLTISGDLTNTASKEEFKIASDFLGRVRSSLEKYSTKPINIIPLPGNHDCVLPEQDNKSREGLIKLIHQTGEESIDESVIDILTRAQENYFEFADQVTSSDNKIHSSKLLNIFKFTTVEKTIIIYCYNTAYISQRHELPGKMVFPIGGFDEELFKEKADLFITCFHHPLHWLKPENRKEFKFHIEKTSDFYFTGHEHEHTKSAISDLEDNIIYNVEGDVLQETGEPKHSGFNLVNFDLKTNKFQISNYKWHGDKYANESSDAWTSYERGVLKIKNTYELKKEFFVTLNDAGANFAHPRVQIKLSDIFTFPRLEVIDYTADSEKEVTVTTIDSETLIKSLSKDIRLLLSGAENIGKSSLLKVTFSHLHSKGFVPVLIDGHRLKTTIINDFNKIALQHFFNQYTTTEKEDFVQLDRTKLVIIIDDFDKVNINAKYKGRLLSNLIKNFPNLIISGNELMSIEDIITDEAVNEDLFSSFGVYEIREFSHVLKSKLINKWITLGLLETITDEERINKLNQAEIIIRTVTGKNLVPNYPIFLLTILQAIELGNPADLTASTFGHYYQFLISKAFGNSLKSQDEITSYNNYLSELSYWFFKNKIRSIDYAELKKFDVEYRKLFTITPNLDEILRNLCTANIMEVYVDVYEFKYLYIYYFFVSKHLADSIDVEETRKTISALCKRIYRTEFANVLLFLTHHSKDKFLLTEILKNAKELFHELSPCKLQDDTQAINKLADKLPQLVFESQSIEEHREEVNKQNDEQDKEELKEIQKDLSQVADLDEDISELDIVSQLNSAFKTIEVLGQILKNNYGKMTNPVIIDLVEEAYLVGLRTLNIFFTVIENNTDFFVNQIVNLIDEKHIHDKDKIEGVSRKILFGICNQISYNFIKKVSDSLGTQNLENSYEEVLHKNNYNSAKLIDFSIKLDYFKSFPNSEMRNLKDDFTKYPLPLQIMKRMVINYLYLFPTSVENKQRILSFLEIPMSKQRRIDATSTQKKDKPTV
ncbi:MAG: metallophosphoesterase [Chitinophagales bacterium]|nr:metallophosphoesterase [Chitinophagales bacterium]